MTVILETRQLSKSFGATRAVQRVSFSLHAGEVHAIVGENGAGKSTFVKMLSGLLRPDDGGISLMEEEVAFAGSSDADVLGIATIHQELSLVPHLTVAENLVLGRPPTHASRLGRVLRTVSRDAAAREAEAALTAVNAQIAPEARAASLTASQIQLVLIARALHRQMTILILDEPTSALSPVERDELFTRVRALREHDVGIIYISHHLDEVLDLADRVSVFRDGSLVGTHAAARLTVDTLVAEMLNRSLQEMYPTSHSRLGETVLEARGIITAASPDSIDLTIRRGEIVGLSGLIGAGKSEVARALIGADRAQIESLKVAGKPVRVRHPVDAIRSGMVLVPEDRASQGLIQALSVRDNIAVQIMSHKRTRRSVSAAGFISWRRMTRVAQDLVNQLAIRVRTPLDNVRRLSGGNQQKVVLARAFSTRPEVVILDEPTRGVDVGSKVEVYKAIQALASGGTGVLLISSEFEEVLGICDRVLIMRRGRIVNEFDRAAASRELMLRFASAAHGDVA